MNLLMFWMLFASFALLGVAYIGLFLVMDKYLTDGHFVRETKELATEVHREDDEKWIAGFFVVLLVLGFGFRIQQIKEVLLLTWQTVKWASPYIIISYIVMEFLAERSPKIKAWREK